MGSPKQHDGSEERPCPYVQDYRLTGAPFKSTCSRQSNKTSVPWENATSPSSPCSSWSGWNNICPVVVPCAVARNRIGRRWRAPSSPRRPDRHYQGAVERLANDRALRRLCGWESIRALPSEATFSRAFAEFAEGALPSRLHEALITDTMQDQLVGHVSRDATAIEGREKATPKPQQPAKPKRKRGRPRKGEERPKEPSRLERQQEMTLPEMLADLPQSCASAPSERQGLSGILDRLQAAYRRAGIPLSCILTSASVNDSQVAIPLATMTAERVRTCTT